MPLSVALALAFLSWLWGWRFAVLVVAFVIVWGLFAAAFD